jgi:hypothetical protein
MPKGAFLPELLQLHVFARDATEIQRFLQQVGDEVFAPVISAAQAGLPRPTINFRANAYSLSEVVAIASLLHEYVHYLQYTTRGLGLLFYEGRYQRYLWTRSCLQELADLKVTLRFPLIAWFEDAGSSAPAPLAEWRKGWGGYQAAIATNGLGPPVGWEEAFNEFVRREFAENWFPMTALKEPNGTVLPVELSVSRLLETEADAIVIAFLADHFPDMCAAARDELHGPPDPTRRSFALPLIHSGLTYVVPIIADYAMQLPLHTSGKLRSASAAFADMLGVVKDRYAGMSIEHIPEPLSTVTSCIPDGESLETVGSIFPSECTGGGRVESN